jgi:hypothetical protein
VQPVRSAKGMRSPSKSGPAAGWTRPRPAARVALELVNGAGQSEAGQRDADPGGATSDTAAARQRVFDEVQDCVERSGQLIAAQVRWQLTDLLVDAILTGLRVSVAPVLRYQAADELGRYWATLDLDSVSLMRSIQLAFRICWRLAPERVESGLPASADSDSALLWALQAIDEVSERSAQMYTAARGDIEGATPQGRQRVFDRLLLTNGGDRHALHRAASALNFALDANYLVFAGLVPDGQPGPELEAVKLEVRTLGVTSYWRSWSHYFVGAVETSSASVPVVEAIGRALRGLPVAAMREVQGLTQVPFAVRLSLLTVRSLPPAAATQLNWVDENLLAPVISAAEESAQFLTATVLGPLLDGPSAKSAHLLKTLKAYFDSAGSIPETARRLYMHRNTVRNQLQRIEHLTGRSFREPRDIAVLVLALMTIESGRSAQLHRLEEVL